MTHDELLMLVTGGTNYTMAEEHLLYRKALRAVVELHRPSEIADAYGDIGCVECDYNADYKIWNQPYPCPTIQAIEKELG